MRFLVPLNHHWSVVHGPQAGRLGGGGKARGHGFGDSEAGSEVTLLCSVVEARGLVGGDLYRSYRP
jgi:hypothetical protein